MAMSVPSKPSSTVNAVGVMTWTSGFDEVVDDEVAAGPVLDPEPMLALVRPDPLAVPVVDVAPLPPLLEPLPGMTVAPGTLVAFAVPFAAAAMECW